MKPKAPKKLSTKRATKAVKSSAKPSKGGAFRKFLNKIKGK